MSRKRSPAAQTRRHDYQTWKASLVEQRPLGTEPPLLNVGVKRLQVIRMPAFADGDSWDIRESNDRWSLFHATIPNGKQIACGYSELVANSDELRAWFERVCEINIRLKPRLSDHMGRDGTSCELALFGDLGSSWRFRWWSKSPEQWKQLVDLADKMMSAFERLEAFDS